MLFMQPLWAKTPTPLRTPPRRSFLSPVHHRNDTQWSNCGRTRGNGVPLLFLAGKRRSPSLHDDSYLQHKQQKKKLR